MKTQAQTSSNYKHHNNWKALVDISLNGIGTFVSFLWTDQVSDKELTKCSGLLKSGLELEPGYNNMADRGSDIADILPSGKFYPHFPQANFPPDRSFFCYPHPNNSLTVYCFLNTKL